VYLLSVVGEPERAGASAVVTLSLERADGIERIAFRCVVGAAMPNDPALEDRLAPWIERQFEVLREAALKSIRSEGKLLEIVPEIPDKF